MKWNERSVRSLLLCVFAVFPCVSCSRGDDVASIRALIEKGARLAEAHDVQGVLNLADQDLKVMPGKLGRREAKAALWRTFKYYGSMRVFHPRANVEVNEAGDRALARLPFLIVKREQGHPELEQLPEDPLAWVREVGEYADLYRLKMGLMKRDGDWLVSRATFERFTGMGFEE